MDARAVSPLARDFTFPPGWRGRVLERMRGMFERGVAESLARLKRAAESALDPVSVSDE